MNVLRAIYRYWMSLLTLVVVVQIGLAGYGAFYAADKVSDASINEDPNAATKVAIRLLGPRRVGWLFCQQNETLLEGNPVKDLNDLVRVGADIAGMLTWWTDLASTE